MQLSCQSDGRIRCTVAIEHLGAAVPSRVLLRDAWVTLGRDEFRELALQVTNSSGPEIPRNFPLRRDGVRLFTRFMKDGKSSVRLGSGTKGVQLLFSNCPPDLLRRFIQTLRIKFKATQEGVRPVSERTRLLSGLPRTFDTVSPVQVRDLQQGRVRQILADVATTPTKSQALCGELRKRARDESVTEIQSAKKLPWLMRSRATLTQDQSMVLNAVLSGKNVFFTGSAGTGKSYLLKKIVASLPPNSTYATASTGVAACQIGGTTLHAFAGIGSGKAPLHQCTELAQRSGVRLQWLNCCHLIIDEISMVDGEFFDKLEAVARTIRKCEDPFGGIQLIICGDFLQLPPVSKGTEQAKFCFQAKSWMKCIHLNMELTKVQRQTDRDFIALLDAVRQGRCTEEVTKQLTATAAHRVERDGILATQLCTHKDDVELTNTKRLQKLSGEPRCFKAVDSDPGLVKTLDAQCPVSSIIELKLGAQVMLTKNLDVSRGLVNGARGVVIGFETEGKGLPKVRFLCGVTTLVGLERWVLKGPAGTHLTRQQLPLKLAWAISIHKSQGMSLDCVEISLARVFECGQAYVALSRARSLTGLRVLDFDPSAVKANSCVLHFYRCLRKEQFLAQASLKSYIQADKEN
ncbi:ATP-dependent DNA helicase PIF1 isoform X2 [Sphaerodactylus townsendi]|uniref:ATP-dependent DNA helicase PIF1 isoform X2 n=1 Tax=Sphaerodactylus townsendi TaxID=933632 RepID=UPI00202715EA|nr:ATP-dependent DNA helicase PIF1 isoform X2 [Sphaerodactylus townsendi]